MKGSVMTHLEQRLAAAGDLQHRAEGLATEQFLMELVKVFHSRLLVACSFQKESSVLMDLMLRVDPNTRFVTLDTGLLFPETHSTWERLEERYGIRLEVHRGIDLEQQQLLFGDELWRTDPTACCEIRKVAPLTAALSTVDAWVSGVRREQSVERRSTKRLAWDPRNGLWKANPLAGWTERDVWHYIREHDLPYNELHDRGYGSIGCTHCTLPGAGREGRWVGTRKQECGLHREIPTVGDF